jgi:hypothetical protein
VLQLVIIAAALGVAVTPLPRATVERVYARGVYPVIQPRLTAFSNHLTPALFDVMLVGLILAPPCHVVRRTATKGARYGTQDAGETDAEHGRDWRPRVFLVSRRMGA